MMEGRPKPSPESFQWGVAFLRGQWRS